jgi:hypothetical protein
MAEEWRVIPEFTNYEVSNQGRVRNTATEHVLTPSYDKDGYAQLSLSKHARKIHRLVASVFIGDITGKDIDHLDHNRANNNVENLRICSHSQNQENRTSAKGHIYEYFDELPEDAIVVREYNGRQLENYYYYDRGFYFWNGLKYRKLVPCEKRDGYFMVCVKDIHGKPFNIYFTVWREMIGEV